MQNKINIVVTGSTLGIGFATVKALAKSDKAYNIFVTSRKQANAEAAIEKLVEQLPDTNSTFNALEIDLGNKESVDAFVANLVEKDIQLDVLMNNAGINGFEEAKKTKEGRDRILTVNYTKTRYPTEKMLGHNRIKENGKIINIGSLTAVSLVSTLSCTQNSSSAFSIGRAGATRISKTC